MLAVMVAMVRMRRRRRKSLFICCLTDHHSDHEDYHFEEGFRNGNSGDNDKNVDNDAGIVRVD